MLARAAYGEALALIERCLEFDATNAGLYHLAAKAAEGLKATARAETYWQKALEILPPFAEANFGLGLLYRRAKRFSRAEACFRQALDVLPDAAIHCNLGLVLTMQSRFGEAEIYLRKALEMLPNSVEVLCNLGNLLTHSGRPAEAFDTYRQALELDPTSLAAWGNLGALLADEHKDEAAEKCLRHALRLDPEYALARINLGYLLLAQGRWEEGWQCHEARFTAASADDETFFPLLPFPQWQGESLAGQSILVWLEQGHGDVIQFCRFLSLLRSHGAARVTLLCQPPLVPLIKPLLATMPGDVELLAYDEMNDANLPHDFWTFLLSIPYRCHASLANIPAQIPYLHALPERMEKWRSVLPAGKLRVGLVWKGNVRHSNDEHRSIPHLSLLAPLWEVPGVQFISLQKGQGEEEAEQPPADQPLRHLGSSIQDFADTAAIVAQLDLLICVDTAVAHVAGALGKTCWVMLPEYKTDWRWLRNRSDTPWYPGVLRLFRQSKRKDWTTVIEEVRVALLHFAASPATS